MCADPALRSERYLRAGWEEPWRMDCPLCFWVLPPPHCHGALVFDGETYLCDLWGRECHEIHPLARQFDQAEPPPPAGTTWPRSRRRGP